MLGGAGALRLAGLWAASGFSYLSKSSKVTGKGRNPQEQLCMSPWPRSLSPLQGDPEPKTTSGGGGEGTTPCLSFPNPKGAKGDKQWAEAAALGMGKETLGLSAGVPPVPSSVCSNLRDLLGVGVSNVLALQLCLGNAPSAAKAPWSSSKYPTFQPGPGRCRASPWALLRRQQLLPERGRSVSEPGSTLCSTFPLWSCCLGRQRWPGMFPCPHPVGTWPPAPT